MKNAVGGALLALVLLSPVLGQEGEKKTCANIGGLEESGGTLTGIAAGAIYNVDSGKTLTLNGITALGSVSGATGTLDNAGTITLENTLTLGGTNFTLALEDADEAIRMRPGIGRLRRRGTRGPVLLEVRRINGVHLRKLIHVREINLDRDHVHISHLRFAQNHADVFEHLFDFGVEIVRDLLSLQVAPDLPGHVQRAIH